MRAMLDTNVVLDVVLKRAPFDANPKPIFQLAEQGEFEMYVSAITPVNLFYIGRKAIGNAAALGGVIDLLKIARVCTVDKNRFSCRSRIRHQRF